MPSINFFQVLLRTCSSFEPIHEGLYDRPLFHEVDLPKMFGIYQIRHPRHSLLHQALYDRPTDRPRFHENKLSSKKRHRDLPKITLKSPKKKKLKSFKNHTEIFQNLHRDLPKITPRSSKNHTGIFQKAHRDLPNITHSDMFTSRNQ